MPEGPEVRYLSEIVKKYTLHKTLKNIISNTKSIVTLPKQSKIINVGRKGKLMWIETNDYYLYIHFGLTGWILFENSKYPKYVIEVDGLKLYIDDSRRFSKLHVLKDKSKHEKLMEKFGVDILTDKFTSDIFKTNLHSKSAMIVSVIMDQGIFAGIGNYIKNDSLYIAKIDPRRKSDDLSNNEMIKLYDAIRYVSFSNLIEMLKMGRIEIPKDIIKIKPKILEIPYKFKVYSNEKDPLGNKITTEQISGRTTYYVKKIQK